MPQRDPQLGDVVRVGGGMAAALYAIQTDTNDQLRSLLREWLDVGAAMGGGPRADLTQRTLDALGVMPLAGTPEWKGAGVHVSCSNAALALSARASRSVESREQGGRAGNSSPRARAVPHNAEPVSIARCPEQIDLEGSAVMPDVSQLVEIIRDYAQHDSWRCEHPPHFYYAGDPPENDCACGLVSSLREAGLPEMAEEFMPRAPEEGRTNASL